MLTAKNLERLIEFENRLRSEYQGQLDAQSAQIENCSKERQEQQAIIDKQLKLIATLSTQATANKHTEQLNRELNQRCENLSEKIATHKQHLKALQKDLAEERAQVKTLTQFDPAKMKKNLDANKKKLAEKTAANDLLQRAVNKSRTEKAEVQSKITELETKLAQLEDTEPVELAAA